MSRWRVFVGDWNDGDTPGWCHWDAAFPDWRMARRFLMDRLAIFLDEPARDDTRFDALEARKLARRLMPGFEFVCMVEGDDYRLTQAPDA